MIRSARAKLAVLAVGVAMAGGLIPANYLNATLACSGNGAVTNNGQANAATAGKTGQCAGCEPPQADAG